LKVSLFATCLVDQFFPQVGVSVVRLLRRQGCEIDFPEQQTCCGQPAFNTGYVEEARKIARHTLKVFADAEYVVLPSGSCAGMIHHYYPELFAHEKSLLHQAERFIEKTYEFSQFMVNVLGVEDVGARFPHRVTYHPSCHGTRLLGVRQEPLTLLRHVRQLELVPLPHAEDCCGFGGTFSVKLGDVSAKMVEEKVENILRSGAEYVVGMDTACLMNIGGYMKRHEIGVQTLHLAELLDRGLNGQEAPE